MKKFLFLVSLLFSLVLIDCGCDSVSSEKTNGFSLVIGSNDYVVRHGDINGYTTISNLIDYRYYLSTNISYDLVTDGNGGTVLSSNFINDNVITNYYWTNDLTTNDYQFLGSSNDYLLRHGDIAGYNTISNLPNYKYCILTNNTYTLIGDANNIGYSNFVIDDVITNYYWTNTLITNNNHYLLSNTALNLVDVYRPSLSDNNDVGYRFFLVKLRSHFSFYLYPNGNVESGALNDNQTVTIGSESYTFRSHSTIIFYSNGSVKQGALFINQTVTIGSESYTFSGNNTISFYSDGSVKQGRLSGNQTINGTTYNHNTYIRFNQDGTINSSGSTWVSSF